MSDRSSNRVIRDLEHTLGLLDSLLDQPPETLPDSAIDMADSYSSYRTSSPPSEVNTLTLSGLLDLDSLRPKSFLHDEMDEFNQIFSELARPKQPKLNYLSSDFNGSSSSLSDGNQTPVARRSPPRNVELPVGKTPVASVNTPSHTHSDVENRLFITEDVEKDSVGENVDVKPAVETFAMRRSLSCAETSGSALIDCDSRLYGSLTSGVRLRSARTANPLVRLRAGRTSANGEITERPSSRSTEDCLNEDDADSGYQSGNNTLVSSSNHGQCQLPSALCDLQRRINSFNNNSHGLSMTTEPNTDVFQGFIRVHLNLHKPINMALTARPSSIYDVISSSQPAPAVDAGWNNSTEIVSFYLPTNTVKVIHITSEMTTPMVVQTLLNKFMITDNCSKFVLYEKLSANGARVEKPLSEMMRRLNDDERPLDLCLRWSDEGVDSLDRHQFILQDNVTTEIMWDAFSLPELEAFLRILDREEESYISQIRLKYSARKLATERQLKEMVGKCSDSHKPLAVAL